jgi:hypothetical protein
MEVLKGLGATASVSGWKSQVRKAARSVGLADVAALNPYGSGSASPVPVVVSMPSNSKSIDFDFQRPLIREMTEKGLLHGLSRRKFAVRRSKEVAERLLAVFTLRLLTFSSQSVSDVKGPSFVFELSVRKASSTKLAKTGLHLTYLGSVEKCNTSSLYRRLPGASLSADLPVLEDVTEALESPVELRNDPFSTLLPGLGVIELGKYGVKPFPLQSKYV